MGGYKEKKEKHFLSTILEIKTERMPQRGRKDLGTSKLSTVNDCNKYMGGVDRNDTLIGNNKCTGKTFKWTVKVVMHFIEEAVLNVYIFLIK